jgi:hypothetical protein
VIKSKAFEPKRTRGVIRSRDLTVVLLDQRPEMHILRARLSSCAIPCVEPDTDSRRNGQNALLDQVISGLPVVWEKQHRQSVVVGDVGTSMVIHLCLHLQFEGLETFVCPSSLNSNDDCSLSLLRLSTLGVAPISPSQLLAEIGDIHL